MRAMLEHWIRKGRVRRIDAGPPVRRLLRLRRQAPEVYEWVDRAPPR